MLSKIKLYTTIARIVHLRKKVDTVSKAWSNLLFLNKQYNIMFLISFL